MNKGKGIHVIGESVRWGKEENYQFVHSKSLLAVKMFFM